MCAWRGMQSRMQKCRSRPLRPRVSGYSSSARKTHLLPAECGREHGSGPGLRGDKDWEGTSPCRRGVPPPLPAKLPGVPPPLPAALPLALAQPRGVRVRCGAPARAAPLGLAGKQIGRVHAAFLALLLRPLAVVPPL